MDRKTFLHLSSAATVSSLLLPEAACNNPEPKTPIRNWAGNIVFSTDNEVVPKTAEELRSLVAAAKELKAQGTRHCFNRIADSKQELLSTRQLNQVIALDKEKMTVTVQAGMKYGDLAPYLHQQGFALHNLASLPHISIAGSVATATHGSGVSNGNLATAVEALELVNGQGELIRLSREKDGDLFRGAVVGLGALGVVTQLTLKLQPAFEMQQYVYEFLPYEQLFANFESIMGAAYSVSLFTDWQQESVNEVWIKATLEQAAGFSTEKEFFGAQPAKKDLHPIAVNDAVNCTHQLGVKGPWYERLPHFKMGFTPSSGVELQAEYFIPFDKAVDAIRAITALGREIGPHLFISEIRAIAADELWLSTAYQRKSIAIHFTWKQETEAVMALLPKVEKALEPFAPRPHWGKLFTVSKAELASRYPRMEDFRKLAAQMDSAGKFSNAYLQEHVLG